MKVLYNVIDCGLVTESRIKDFDGDWEINNKRIESDLFDGQDPLKKAFSGLPSIWIEAIPIPDKIKKFEDSDVEQNDVQAAAGGLIQTPI